jgi:hypothetical protein
VAAKAPAKKAVSLTTSTKYKLVSRRISPATSRSPAVTKAQASARRQALIKANNMRRAQQLQRSRAKSFFKLEAATRKMQLRYLNARQRQSALADSARQSLQMSRGAQARRTAIKRAFRQYGLTSYARGRVLGLQRWTTQSALQTLTLQQALASTKTRNSSTAARLAQSNRARAANKTRTRNKAQYVQVYVPVGSTTGNRKAQAKARATAQKTAKATISRRRSARGKAPVKAAKKPKASIRALTYCEPTITGKLWITAGNDQGTENCAAVAIANHLLYKTGLRMDDDQVNLLAEQGETIPELLEAMKNGLFENVGVTMYCRDWSGPGAVNVYETTEGTHAVLSLPSGLVVSHGTTVYPTSHWPAWIWAESWYVSWLILRQSK